jgi:hypothetical protein
MAYKIKKETQPWNRKIKFAIVSKGEDEHYPLNAGFDTEEEAITFAKKEYGHIKGLKIVKGYY